MWRVTRSNPHAHHTHPLTGSPKVYTKTTHPHGGKGARGVKKLG